MDSTLALFVTGLLLIGTLIWRTHQQSQLERQKWGVGDALDEFREVIELVEKFAPAVDQLVKINELKPEERRDEVIRQVREILPAVDIDLVIKAVEWWVATQKPQLKADVWHWSAVVGE